MSKTKINETKFFTQVAEIIGNYHAFIEIGRLKITDVKTFDKPINKAIKVWNKTPQGFHFWHSINAGVNPIKK